MLTRTCSKDGILNLDTSLIPTPNFLFSAQLTRSSKLLVHSFGEASYFVIHHFTATSLAYANFLWAAFRHMMM